MDVTPRELRDIDIREGFRGYNRDDVDELLERAAATIEGLNERIRRLTEQVSAGEGEQGKTRETEDMLHRTLLLAQRAADEAVAEAQTKARQILDDAETQVARRSWPRPRPRPVARSETERRRLESEVLELGAAPRGAARRRRRLERFESEYRVRLRRALEADLESLAGQGPVAPSPRPPIHDVELPAAESPRPHATGRADRAFRRHPRRHRSPPAPSPPPTPPPVAAAPQTPQPPSTDAGPPTAEIRGLRRPWDRRRVGRAEPAARDAHGHAARRRRRRSPPSSTPARRRRLPRAPLFDAEPASRSTSTTTRSSPACARPSPTRRRSVRVTTRSRIDGVRPGRRRGAGCSAAGPLTDR